jgi:antitoxin (DNA-binding transcriptional repressor) of toxin-antitoxin stability system
MIIRASVTDVLRNFSDYLNRIAYRGERFLLVRGGKPVAELSPVPGGRRLGELPALLESLPRLGDEDAASFAVDLDAARAEMDAGSPPADPWAS